MLFVSVLSFYLYMLAYICPCCLGIIPLTLRFRSLFVCTYFCSLHVCMFVYVYCAGWVGDSLHSGLCFYMFVFVFAVTFVVCMFVCWLCWVSGWPCPHTASGMDRCRSGLMARAWADDRDHHDHEGYRGHHDHSHHWQWWRWWWGHQLK